MILGEEFVEWWYEFDDNWITWEKVEMSCRIASRFQECLLEGSESCSFNGGEIVVVKTGKDFLE